MKRTCGCDRSTKAENARVNEALLRAITIDNIFEAFINNITGRDITADAVRVSFAARDAGIPARRRPLLTQMMSPEFRPDLALAIIARLEAQIDELERSLAEARS